jgi:hypothetical protein
MAGAPGATVLDAADSYEYPLFSVAYVMSPGWLEDLARISQIVHRAQINASTNQPKSQGALTMKTLIITDLARTETLDRATMTTVRGGHNQYWAPSYTFGDITYAPKSDTSINASQSLSQLQNVMTATANGSAFVDGVNVHNDVSQDGKNVIVRR